MSAGRWLSKSPQKTCYTTKLKAVCMTFKNFKMKNFTLLVDLLLPEGPLSVTYMGKIACVYFKSQHIAN